MLIGYLHPEDSDNYQAIYFSQLYGTFFGVFVKFTEQDLDASTNTHTIKKLDFKLINYKGPINLGITDISEPKIDASNKIVTINIEVQALHGKLDPPTYIWPSSAPKLVKGQNQLEFTRTVKRLPSKVHNNVFDDEFHYREGIEDVLTNAPFTKKRKVLPAEVSNDVERIPAGGSICPRSLNNII